MKTIIKYTVLFLIVVYIAEQFGFGFNDVVGWGRTFVLWAFDVCLKGIQGMIVA